MIKFPILRFHTGRRQAKGPGWRCPDINYQFELFAKFGDSGVASIQIIINHLILRQINLARVWWDTNYPQPVRQVAQTGQGGPGGRAEPLSQSEGFIMSWVDQSEAGSSLSPAEGYWWLERHHYRHCNRFQVRNYRRFILKCFNLIETLRKISHGSIWLEYHTWREFIEELCGRKGLDMQANK